MKDAIATHRTGLERRIAPHSLPRAAAVLLLAGLIAAALAVSGCGGGSSGASAGKDATPTTTGPTLGSAMGATPPSSDAHRLREVPPLQLGDIRLVELRGSGPQGALMRVLSPALDEAAIAEILGAVSALALDSGEPAFDGLPGPLLTFVLRTTDDRELDIMAYADGRGLQTVYAAAGVLRDSSAHGDSVVALAQRWAGDLQAETGWVDRTPWRLPEEMPADFGLILAYGVTARNVLDTFGGSFTKDLISSETPTAGTTFSFTDAQLREIYGLLRGVDITGYPVQFLPADDDQYWVTPSQTYYLRLRAGGRTSEIRWDDQNESRVKEAADLRRVIRRIQEMIEVTHEYKALPRARGGYL
jgi:hypothetical protein